MLLRQRQLLNKVHALSDAALFGGVFWLAHFVRSLPQLDADAVIGGFEKYQWLLLVVVPFTPPLLELQGFYHRPILASRRQSLAQILRGSAWVSLAIIVAMFFTKQEVARGVVSLFLPMVVCAMVLKEEMLRLWARSRLAGQEARRRVILIGGEREMSRLDESGPVLHRRAHGLAACPRGQRGARGPQAVPVRADREDHPGVRARGRRGVAARRFLPDPGLPDHGR